MPPGLCRLSHQICPDSGDAIQVLARMRIGLGRNSQVRWRQAHAHRLTTLPNYSRQWPRRPCRGRAWSGRLAPPPWSPGDWPRLAPIPRTGGHWTVVGPTEAGGKTALPSRW